MMGFVRGFSFHAKFIVFFICLDISVVTVLGNHETDKLALLSIKDRITDDPYGITRSWNDSLHFCQWRGVSCGKKHQRVTQLNVRSLSLKGSLSSSIGNLTFLRTIDLSNNSLNGELPNEISRLFRLEELVLEKNSVGGKIPISLSNCSRLRILNIGFNEFTGGIPVELGLLQKLVQLKVRANKLEGSIPHHLGNISSLQELNISVNNLDGSIPESLGQLKSLIFLSISANILSGTVPKTLYNLSNLEAFVINVNHIQGSFPHDIGFNLPNIQIFRVWQNQLSGSIPVSLSNFSNLVEIDLSDNKFSGGLPAIFGNFKELMWVDISYTNLGSGKASDLDFLTSFTNCSNLILLELQVNNFGGRMPNSVGSFSAQLEILSLEGNRISGSIESLHSLKAIDHMDLSHNNFSGHIPRGFAKFVFLAELDLSFNDLEGEVPSGGIFSNVSGNISLAGNNKLCGGMAKFHLNPCPKKSPRRHDLSLAGKLIISIVCGILVVVLVSSFLVICCSRKNKRQDSESLSRDVPFMNISYGELLRATNGFCPENLIGAGGFGSVYRGILEQHQLPIAVKVFNLERRGASKSFMVECETLRNIRHRNLVKIITACSSTDFQGNDFKALVYEIMSNGSLEDWLHPQTGENQKRSLTLSQRLNIVIDVASALDYLHNHSELPIIHCDLKPSNILLDKDMVTHVGDFGLSRIIVEDDLQISENPTSSVGLRGTIGYAAPEYGMGSPVSIQGDVYSFGILLLELFTGKNPTDETLEGLSLHQFVKLAFPKRVMEIVDESLLIEGDEEEFSSRVHECLVSIFTIALNCSEELPIKRMTIDEALKNLHKTKKMLLKDTRINNAT